MGEEIRLNSTVKNKTVKENTTSQIILIKQLNHAANNQLSNKKRINYHLMAEIVNILISLFVTCAYIYSTYDTNYLEGKNAPEGNTSSLEENEIFLYTFISANSFFALHLLTLYFLKIKNQQTSNSVIIMEYISILGFFGFYIISKFDTSHNKVYILISLCCNSFRIYKLDFLTRFIDSDVNKKLYNIIVVILTLLIISTSIINLTENYSSINEVKVIDEQDCKNCDIYQSYDDTLFFILTTVAIIGYYSNVVSVVGRLFIIVLIIVSLLIIPSASSEFMNLIANKSIYARNTYKRNTNVDFILITGNISFNCFSLISYDRSAEGILSP